MKSYKIWQEGWFSKKKPEDKDEKEQKKYNDLWMKLHKRGSKLTKTMTPPSVYRDDSWATKTIKLHKKLRLTVKDNPGVLS